MRNLLLTTTIFLLISIFYMEVNAQTSCSSPVSLSGLPTTENSTGCVSGTTSDGTLSTVNGTTSGGCGTVVEEYWYSFTIPAGLPNYQIDLYNGSATRNLGFQILQGETSCSATAWTGTVATCQNATGGGGDETYTYWDMPAGTYYIRILSYQTNNVNFDLCFTYLADPPANDECANAIPLTVGANGICSEVTGTNSGATSSAGIPAPGCGGYLGGDVWYSMVVPASGNITIATDYAASSSVSDLDMAIYSGTCGSLTLIECDDFDGIGLMPFITRTGLTPGATIYLRIWEYANNTFGEFDLCVSDPPASDNNQDCVTETVLCSDGSLGGASNGAGSVVDLGGSNRGCLLGDEHQSSWYQLTVATPGTFAFTMAPANGSDDYDFAVWHYAGGAGETCPPNRNPDRCSWGAGAGAGGSYNTGMGNGAVDTSEDDLGDNWVSELNVVAGDVLVIVIDNFSVSLSPFSVDFTGTCGLDCGGLLPIEMMTFYGKNQKEGNILYWSTASEINNDYFTIEHSTDGENWRDLGKIQGAGNSNELLEYEFVHFNPDAIVNYYRFHQTDYDGESSNYKVISIDNRLDGKVVVKTTNLLGQEIDEHYHGVVIDVFEDGSIRKRYQ